MPLKNKRQNNKQNKNRDTEFASTTTLSGSAVFTLGSVADGGTSDTEEELYMQYAYNLDVDSSFTGEDLLTVGVVTGNASGPLENMDSAKTGAGDLAISSLYYTFPILDTGLSVTVGTLLGQDDVVAATTSKYSDGFRLGSMPYSEAGAEKGPGIAIAYNNPNGVVASASYVSPYGNYANYGINSDNANDVSTISVGYTGDSYGGGLVITHNDGDYGSGGYNTVGGGVYFSPESIDGTISVAYDTKDPDGNAADESDFFVGIDYEVGPGTLSAAYNSTDVDGSDSLDSTGYEVYYSYAVNDSVTITPGFFTVEDTSTGDDDTGVVLETKFSF